MKERVEFGSAIRDALPVFDASPELREWAREQTRRIDEEAPPETASLKRKSSRFWAATRLPVAAGLILAAASGLGAGSILFRNGPSTGNTANQLIDAHVRSMLPGHLLDVKSSDRHTVKPWFAGKTDIAPQVFELEDRGFPLLGGRLDYVDGRSVAALAYARRLHTINLFVWRHVAGDPADGSFTTRGYSLVHWTSNGLNYWAVSDASRSDLEAFRDAYTK